MINVDCSMLSSLFCTLDIINTVQSYIFMLLFTYINMYDCTKSGVLYMIIVKSGDLRSNLKKYMDMVSDTESIIVPRKDNFVAIISNEDYEFLQKAKENQATS